MRRFSPALWLTLALSAASLGAQTSSRTITTPPASAGLDPFYRKYAVYRDLPIVSSAKPADDALLRAYDIVAVMMAKRPEVLARMVQNRLRLAVDRKSVV